MTAQNQGGALALRIIRSEPFNGRLALDSRTFQWIKAHAGILWLHEITEQELYEFMKATGTDCVWLNSFQETEP